MERKTNYNYAFKLECVKKTVLNPVEVQKLVTKEIKKNYSVGVRDTPKKK